MEQQEKNNDKLTDKAFSRLMLTSVLGILLCIACLCSATWAWFSTDVASSQNTLKAGVFDLVVAVADDASQPVPVTKNANGAYVCTLGAATYTVTLSVSEDTTVTKGYCVITVNGTTYTESYAYDRDNRVTQSTTTIDESSTSIVSTSN